MQKTPLQTISHSLFLFGVLLLAVSLPWSKFLMSNAQIILLVSWLLDKELLKKIKQFAANRSALALSALFLIHVAGLSYTSDWALGSEDVRKKIPLMLLPLIFSTAPALSKKMLDGLLGLFTASVLAATGVCMYILLGYTSQVILQPRDASVFISHIRLSLLVSLSLFILARFAVVHASVPVKIISALSILWLLLFLVIMESETGLVCTAVMTSLLIVYGIFYFKRFWVRTALVLLIAIPLVAGIRFFFSEAPQNDSMAVSPLPAYTVNGNPYLHDTSGYETENGYKVWESVCEKELETEWNKRSSIKYDEQDLKGNEVKYTLIRFLTSKGMRKDSAAVALLSKKEVLAVEKGIPNADYMGIFNPGARMKKIMWEFEKYLRGGNPSGHSVVQRIEFWKAAIGIIKENPVCGVGTGDLDIAFADQYNRMNSPLTTEWRLRAHNQFLAVTAALGTAGLLVFLFSLVYPVLREKKWSSYYYVVFFVIAVLSFLTEDTLETQAGVTFFAFFNSLFLFLDKQAGHTGS